MKLSTLKAQAQRFKEYTLIVYFTARDPRTPFLVRVLAVVIAAYALSPIDFIPDFIPIIGYLDDFLLLPLALALIVRLTPSDVLKSAQSKAQQTASKPVSYSAATFIIVFWLIVISLLARWVLNALRI